MSSTIPKRKAGDLSSTPAKKVKANASITSFFGQPKPVLGSSQASSSFEADSTTEPPVTTEAPVPASSPLTTVTPITTGTIASTDVSQSTEISPSAKAPVTTHVPTTTQPASTSLSAFITKPTITKKAFDKAAWIAKLTDDQRTLLQLEIDTLDESWLPHLADELTSNNFLDLKRFLRKEAAAGKTIFPPSADVYSWSRHTPLPSVKAVILGQDPYHNHAQAHGLCFSIRPPTPAPPSLKNIYKALQKDYPTFKPPPNNGGLLTPWANNGVLLLNTCLTVEAHQANSHANKGWERFTGKVIETVNRERKGGVVFLAWGAPAQKRCVGVNGTRHLVLKSVHPSPLSASRGWFDCGHFKKANQWLREKYGEEGEINWDLNVAPEKAGV